MNIPTEITQTSKVRKIYLATSWRNKTYQHYLTMLRIAGHEVYDFRDPDFAFKWSQIGLGDHEQWSQETYLQALKTPQAYRGFNRDFEAMQWCDVGILLMPAGDDAHLELGWMAGKNKWTIIHFPQPPGYTWSPGLMKKLASVITMRDDRLLSAIERAP